MSDTSNEELTKRFVQLAELERELKAKLGAVQEERIATEARLLDYWSENGITQMRVSGLTVYPHTSVYASAPREAVEAAGLGDLLSVSSQSLSAYVRERRASGEPLPPALEAAIRITEKTSLRTRKGT